MAGPAGDGAGGGARAEKAAAVAEISDRFRRSAAALLTEYRGLTTAQLTELRRSLGRQTTYTVVKNTLTRRAAQAVAVTLDEDLLAGPTAIAFVQGDPVEAAKGIRDFARGNPALVIKGGVLDGAFLTADEVRRLADLESREVLLARLAGVMTASLAQAASLFQAPLAQVARLAAALQETRATTDSAAPAAAATGPADETPATTADETPATTADETPATTADETPATTDAPTEPDAG